MLIDTSSGHAIVKIVRHKNIFKGLVLTLSGIYTPITLDCLNVKEVKNQTVYVLNSSIKGEGPILEEHVTWL